MNHSLSVHPTVKPEHEHVIMHTANSTDKQFIITINKWQSLPDKVLICDK